MYTISTVGAEKLAASTVRRRWMRRTGRIESGTQLSRVRGGKDDTLENF